MGAVGTVTNTNNTQNTEGTKMTEQATVKTATNYFTDSDVNDFRAFEGENRADLINQVAKKLGGNIGGNTLYSTKNGVNVGDYQITLSTKKDKKLGKQVITAIMVMHRKKQYEDMRTYYVR